MNCLIENKRVAFVGACPNIRGLGYGGYLDNYDVIVKTNGSIYFESEEYFADYGSRVDVLYTNNQFYREMSPLPVGKMRDRGVKYLRMKTCQPKDLKRYREFNANVITSAIREVNKNVTGALMGCYIVRDILDHNPAELHLTGIDFFLSKKKVFEHDNYSEYIDGYLPDKIRHQGNKINAGKRSDGHNQMSNTKYIHKLYHETGRITTPGFIRDIMEGIVSGSMSQR